MKLADFVLCIAAYGVDMRKLSFRKGLLPIDGLRFAEGRSLAQERVLENFSPKEILVPMLQHVGIPSIPVVTVGTRVDIGQLIGRSASRFGVPIHSGISGVVTEIERISLPNRTTCDAIRIQNDLKRRLHPSVNRREKPERLSVEELRKILLHSGISGMGGEGVSASAKCAQALAAEADTLYVNGLQSEPHLTSDLYLMHERALQVVCGAAAMAVACQISRVVFCIQETWRKEISAVTAVLQDAERLYPSISFSVRVFRARFPQGYDKLIIQAVYGVELRSQESIPRAVKAVIFNVSTCYAFWDMVQRNMPCANRVMTIADEGTSLRNVLVPIGTLISELLERMPGVNSSSRIVIGGALTGVAVTNLDSPVMKTTQGITLIKTNPREKTPCIHCGACVAACPVGLAPYILVRLIDLNEQMVAETKTLSACISCGACSYVCPSGIDLSARIVKAAHRHEIRTARKETQA